MRTKDYYSLPFTEKQGIVVNNISNGKYSNLNLNQNHQNSSNASCCLSKNVSAKKVHLNSDFANKNETKKDSNSWKKSTKNLSSNFGNYGSEKYGELKKGKNSSTTNNSTLSLHIEAYENFVEDSASDFCLKKNNLIKKQTNPKQIGFNSTFFIQNPFEFPRQQESGDAKMPEVSQFKASQRLLNPNSGFNSAVVSLSITATATIRRINSATQTEPCPEYQELSGLSSEQSNHGVQTYTGYIQCRLDDFVSFIYESGAITSDKIYIGGIPWNIKICSKRVNNATNVIGFYTKCGYDFGKDDEGLSNITANIEMVMKSSNDLSKSQFSRKFSETFTKGHSEWGYSEFRTIEEGVIQSHKSCVFEARITVVRPKQKISPEMCLQKARSYMDLAKMQSSRGNLDKAIEANEKAFTLCFEKQDGNVLKEIEKQRDELIEMKLKESIERLQKDDDAAKSAVPLKSACKHIGVLRKPPKKKNNNQRPKIKLIAPPKPKEMKSIGVNTNDTIAQSPETPASPKMDSTEPLKYQPLCMLPHKQAEKVQLLMGLIFPFIQNTLEKRLILVRFCEAEQYLSELIKASGCDPDYETAEYNDHFDSFKESLFEMNLEKCGPHSFLNDIFRVLFPAVFQDYSKFVKDINIYMINMAIDNRKIYEQIVRIIDVFGTLYKPVKLQRRKGKDGRVVADCDQMELRSLQTFYVKMKALPTLNAKTIDTFTNIGSQALQLKVFFRKVGYAKRDFINGFIQRRKAILEKEKNITKSFEDRYERLNARHAVALAQYNAQHLLLLNRKEKYNALLSLQKSVRDIQKHYGEKMGIINKMAKDLENSQMQVQKCEELLFRLKKDREDVTKVGKQKLQEENAERKEMKKRIATLKLEVIKYDIELKKALASESPKRSLSPEKAKAQSINLQLLETERYVATEKLEHITLLLAKDERYLKAELPPKLYECIVQRFKKNLALKQSIQSALDCIDDEMISVNQGFPLNFSRINVPTIFVDDFGEI